MGFHPNEQGCEKEGDTWESILGLTRTRKQGHDTVFPPVPIKSTRATLESKHINCQEAHIFMAHQKVSLGDTNSENSKQQGVNFPEG